MIKGGFSRLVVLCAALCFALASVVSAAQMAPNSDSPQLAAFLAAGGTMDDICGDGGDTHEHDCPFCRLVDDAATVSVTPAVWQMRHYSNVMFAKALILGDLRHKSEILLRGPPARV